MRIEIAATCLLAVAMIAFLVATPGGQFQFEVVSIHPVKRGPGMQVAVTNPTPNGFAATAGMWQLLAFAYGPPAPAWNSTVWQINEMRGEPGWVNEEIYAIQARVSQADLKRGKTKIRGRMVCSTRPCAPCSKNVSSLRFIRSRRNELFLNWWSGSADRG